MAFDILITDEPVEVINPTTEELSTFIAAGIKAGNIVDTHSCVEYVNALVEPNVNGSMVEGLMKRIIAEAKRMNSAADVAILTDSQIDDGEYFTYTDIYEFKLELYGTVEAWVAAVTPEEI